MGTRNLRAMVTPFFVSFAALLALTVVIGGCAMSQDALNYPPSIENAKPTMSKSDWLNKRIADLKCESVRTEPNTGDCK